MEAKKKCQVRKTLTKITATTREDQMNVHLQGGLHVGAY